MSSFPAEPRHVEITASPLRDAEGRIVAGIEVVRDVTERKRLSEEMAKTEKLESVGLLAGGIAHDFNNLLTGIFGNISLARMHARGNELVNERLRRGREGVAAGKRADPAIAHVRQRRRCRLKNPSPSRASSGKPWGSPCPAPR